MVVKSPSETARGDFGIYDLDRKLITLIGNVQLDRENDQVNGARLVIDLDSGRAVVDGGPPGVNQSGGRVTGHFTVPQRQQNRSERGRDHRASAGRRRRQTHDGLEVRSIAKSYDKRAVLHDVCLDVHRGEVVGLLGPNGAGKTTCFYSVMGLVKPDSGPHLPRRQGHHRACRCTAARSSASAICRRKPRSSAA